MARTVASDADQQLFVVERYLPDFNLERLPRAVSTARHAGTGTGRRGRVRHQQSIWIPADETVISTFVADSSEALAEELRSLGVPADRIVEAVRFVPGDIPGATTSKELDNA